MNSAIDLAAPDGIHPPHPHPPAVHAYPPLPALATTQAPYSTRDESDKRSDIVDVAVRPVTRTPSPTPSETRVLENKTRVLADWRKWLDRRRYTSKRGIWTTAAVVIVGILIILFLANQNRIVALIRPVARWMHDTPGGWLIPIAIMFILSFPPLFGHEIIAILCGDVWGVWVGFGIVAAGTVLGELGNFYAFRWCCTARWKKIEEKRLTYALYAEVVRRGGLVVPTVMRLTFIPGHLLTAIFSTCGMSIWMFFGAAVISLPKQLAIVYIGSVQGSGGNTPVTSAIKAVVVLATVAMTYLAMRYVNAKVDQVKADVVYARRKRRQARMGEEDVFARTPSAEAGLDPVETVVSIDEQSAPREARSSKKSVTTLYMPKPQHVVWRESSTMDTHRPQRSGRLWGHKESSGASGNHRKLPDGPESVRPKSPGGTSRDIEVIELGGRDSALRARRHAEDQETSKSARKDDTY